MKMATNSNNCSNSVESQVNGTADVRKQAFYETDISSVYYGVHIPSDIQIQDNDGYINVFQDKLEALKVVKKYKKARFKAFSYYHEAADFAMHGSDYPNNNMSLDGSLFGKLTAETAQVVGEKPSQFRGPKSQDLVKLRKAIEAGDIVFVRTTVWENPRYLISSGDTPSILQEGFRYNALHAATKAKNAEMCALILNTVSDINFVKLLYGDDAHQNAEDRSKVLLDLYLNMPDKGLNETPLHFAVKFGAVECVEVLTSYPECDRKFKNKHGKTPSMIICDRCDNSVPIECKRKIARLLEDSYYVPVLRSEDNCIPPVIGELFSPTSPPKFNSSPLNPRLEIRAYAGPMERQEAEKFRKTWKKTRSLKQASSPLANRSMLVPVDTTFSSRFKDPDKGLERLGKNLATRSNVAWKEYWPFLDDFVDLGSHEGLEMLETYLSSRVCSEYSISPDFSMKSSPGNNASTLSDLCRDFQAWDLNDHSYKEEKSIKAKVPEKRPEIVEKNTEFFKPEIDPFLCVEKSLQVFAHRITNDILCLLEIDCDNSSNITLHTQVKPLQSLIKSCINDDRFSGVNFNAVHARLGLLIANRLKEILEYEDEFKCVTKNIESWLEKCGKKLDYFSSDDESVINHRSTVIKKKSTTEKQTMCLLDCILNGLLSSGSNLKVFGDTEVDCEAVWRESKVCECVWQDNGLQSSFLRNNSLKQRRKRGVFTYNGGTKNGGIENVSKRLSFGDDEVSDTSINKLSNSGETSSDNTNKDSSSDEEDFYTPPESPSLLEYSDDEPFYESHLPDKEVYIAGDCPTKMDYAVFNAIQMGDVKLDPTRYPNVYKWYHNVGLCSEDERQSWSNSCIEKLQLDSPGITSTPTSYYSRPARFSSSMYTPPPSWLRVTGANSPKTSLWSRNGNVSADL